MVYSIPQMRTPIDTRAMATGKQRFGKSVDNEILNSADILASRVNREVPEFGPFRPVEVAFNASQEMPALGKVTYRIGHWSHPDPKQDRNNQRYLDFHAETPSTKSTSDQYLMVGTKAELQKYLGDRNRVLDDTKRYLESTDRAFQEFNAG